MDRYNFFLQHPYSSYTTHEGIYLLIIERRGGLIIEWMGRNMIEGMDSLSLRDGKAYQ
jgi:hypothetical protein